MGLLRNFWQRRRKAEKEAGREETEVIYNRQHVNFHNQEERKRYLTDCLEQIREASKEMELLAGEYSLITGYLTDADEIDMLPAAQKQLLEEVAGQLSGLESRKKAYQNRKGGIPDEVFARMERLEEEIPEGCRKIKETEEYRKLVKKDLHRLDGEQHAYQYRREELENRVLNMRGMAVTCLISVLVCMMMLFILQFGFEMETKIGYVLTAGVAAVLIVWLYMQYTGGEKELHKVNHDLNKIIQLQNKVKIRYVNNANLLNYLYLKYGVESAAELESWWSRYQKEKEEREQFRQASTDLDDYRRELVRLLTRFRIKEPERWIHQTQAILDSREMVEIRHELIQQRQSLRNQLDYNQEIADAAKQEVKKIAAMYPVYAPEILQMVDNYEKKQ